MNFSLSDYSEILTGFSSSLFNIITSSLSVAFIVLLIMLTFMFLLRKTILVKRRHITLRILSISYFVIIPIIAFIGGFKWGLANSIESELTKNVAKYTRDLDTEFKNGLEASITLLNFSSESGATKMQFSANNIIDTFSTIVYDQYGKMLEKANLDKGDFSGKTAAVLLRITKGKGVSYAIKKGIKKLAEDNIGLDQNVTEKVMDVKLNELINNGLFSTILNIQVTTFFNGIKKGIIITFCIILLFPVTEIFIAYRMYKKNKSIALIIPA